MCRRAIALFCLSLLSAGSAMAQAPPPAETPQPSIGEPQAPAPQPSATGQGAIESGRVFCGQSVSYQVAPSSSLPDNYRRFVGVWSDAAWDARTCAALIVEGVNPDGGASIIYVFGPQGPSAPTPGGVLHGTGIVRGGELRFQNSDGSQFAFRPGIVDMIGHWINPKGESFEATFKQTP